MPAVLAQKGRPFHLLRLISHLTPWANSARAHLGLSAPRTSVSRPPSAPRWRAVLQRESARFVLGLLQFLLAAAVVNDPIDYAVVVVQGHFRHAQRVSGFAETETICPLMVASNSGRLNCSVYFCIMSGDAKPSDPRSNFSPLFFV